MKIKNLLVSTVLLSGLFYGCGEQKVGSANSTQNTTEATPAVPVKADGIYDEFAFQEIFKPEFKAIDSDGDGIIDALDTE